MSNLCQSAVSSSSREQVARFKARQAMAWVEDAQRSLSRAAEQLSPVRGAGREHARLLQFYSRIEREWYRLERLFARRLDLDRDPMPAEMDGAAADARRAA
jgi:hypothetical protein